MHPGSSHLLYSYVEPNHGVASRRALQVAAATDAKVGSLKNAFCVDDVGLLPIAMPYNS